MLHPIIELFATKAQRLEAQGDPAGLDDAIAHLAAWIERCRSRLSEEDIAVLGEVGALLYREGQQRRGQ
ncbi:hypothetical protein ACS5PN_30500 [Roseateles sp. NT4]|uniref:hypothetical protein n=1 Tax=Roseateles sp. NT4 TaxID=3453715 RepID=UPI003EF07BA0